MFVVTMATYAGRKVFAVQITLCLNGLCCLAVIVISPQHTGVLISLAILSNMTNRSIRLTDHCGRCKWNVKARKCQIKQIDYAEFVYGN